MTAAFATLWTWLNTPPVLRYLRMAIAVIAVVQLSVALQQLTLGHNFRAAIDTRLRWEEMQAWWSGRPVYGVLKTAIYPPFFYALFAPLFALPSYLATRLLGAALRIVLIAITAWRLPDVAGLTLPHQRSLCRLCFLASTGLVHDLSNGQLSLITLWTTLFPLLPSTQSRYRWSHPFLWVFAAAKISTSLPFFVLALYRRRLFTLLLTGLLVLAATWLSILPRPEPLPFLLRAWLPDPLDPGMGGSSANVYWFFTTLKLPYLATPVSLFAMAAFTLWLYLKRDASYWTLLAAAGALARTWTYHRSYDDLLLILPVILTLRLIARYPITEPLGLYPRVALLTILVGELVPAYSLTYINRPVLDRPFYTYRALCMLPLVALPFWQAHIQPRAAD